MALKRIMSVFLIIIVVVYIAIDIVKKSKSEMGLFGNKVLGTYWYDDKYYSNWTTGRELRIIYFVDYDNARLYYEDGNVKDCEYKIKGKVVVFFYKGMSQTIKDIPNIMSLNAPNPVERTDRGEMQSIWIYLQSNYPRQGNKGKYYPFLYGYRKIKKEEAEVIIENYKKKKN